MLMRAMFCGGPLLLPGASQPAGAPPASSAPAPRIEFEKFTLPNGLQVILHVDRQLPVVHVNQSFRVGSKDERPGRTGFAHLFEHMMFQGSKNAPQDYFHYASEAGANLFAGGVDGTTNDDRTSYWVTAPSASLEHLLWLEADRLATLPQALTQEKLDNQREVVRNERRQSLENRPYGRASKLLRENMYPDAHPYHWHTFGSHEDLQAASLKDAREFFTTHYAPNNLSLVIAGDFDPAQARRWVEKYFGDIPAGPAHDRIKRWVPRLAGEKIIDATDRVPQERVYLAWLSPPYFEAGDAELQLAASTLTDGLSSRLKKALVYDRQLASEVGASQVASEIAGFFGISVTARPGADLSQIERIVTDEIARLAAQGPTAQELQRVKTKAEYTLVSSLEDIGAAGKAGSLNMYNTFLGDPGRFADDLARFRNASVAGVRAAVDQWLNTSNRVVLRFHPEASARPVAQAALDRAVPPPLGADKPFTTPEIKTARLDNGMEILVVERHDVPKVAVTLLSRAGAVADPRGKEGLAHLTVTTADLGTTTRTALEIENALGDLGTELSSGATRESTQLWLEVLSRNLRPAVAILADVTRHPAFAPAEIAREKKIQLDRLAQEASNPKILAARIGDMLLFGREHPYGRARMGLPRSIEAITRDDIAQFHATWWKPGSTALVFAGDISLAAAIELAREQFGSWSGGAAPVTRMTAPQPVGPGKVFVVDRPTAEQTYVAQLLPAPLRASDDYYAFNVVNAVWGGGFESRLMRNLREDKGYSYGMYSIPAFHARAGAWVVSGGVQTSKTRESIVELNAELAGLAGRKPITPAELAQARANLVRGYAQEFRRLDQVVGQISKLWELGMPMAQLQRYAGEMERATLESVNATAHEYVLPGATTLLLIGDYAQIEPRLRDLALGPITLLDEEGMTAASAEEQHR